MEFMAQHLAVPFSQYGCSGKVWFLVRLGFVFCFEYPTFHSNFFFSRKFKGTALDMCSPLGDLYTSTRSWLIYRSRSAFSLWVQASEICVASVSFQMHLSNGFPCPCGGKNLNHCPYDIHVIALNHTEHKWDFEHGSLHFGDKNNRHCKYWLHKMLRWGLQLTP